jgi:hypothetical protein
VIGLKIGLSAINQPEKRAASKEGAGDCINLMQIV